MAMDAPQESPEPSDSDSSGSDDSTVTNEEVTQSKSAARRFIESVEEAFGADSEDFAEFVQLMFDFVDKRIDMKVLRPRIILLFKEHQHLVAGFDTLFPAENEGPMQAQELLQAVVAAESIRFLNSIKEAYRHDEERYKSFLHIMTGDLSRNNKYDEMYEEVSLLFHDRPDLIAAFKKFLPVSPDS